MHKPANHERNAKIKALRAKGVPAKEVAKMFNVTETTIYVVCPSPKKKRANLNAVKANLVDIIHREDFTMSAAMKNAIERTRNLYANPWHNVYGYDPLADERGVRP